MRQLPLVFFAALSAACGSGSHLQGTVSCGAGTTEIDGVCTAMGDVCGTGTHDVGGTCVADRTCGMGTTLVGTECVGLGTTTCGSGTTLQGTMCVATIIGCGTGTMLQGNVCVPSGSSGLTCGAGTMQQGTQCVPTGAAITCGAGTVLQGTTCVASGVTVTCGAGTTLQGNQCIATSPVTCGPGTQLTNNQCVVIAGGDGGSYEVRVPVTQVPADGYSKIPVFSIGTLANGLPSMEPVVLVVNPSYAGTVSPASFNLALLGNSSYFTPCSSSSPACSGTFEITLARAAAPSVPVATSGTLTLVPPTGVGSSAPCVGTSSVIFYSGDSGDYIFPGTETITQGTWSASGGTSYLTIHVDPMDSTQGLWWDLDFSTQQLGQPIAVNVYQNAERAPFASPGHPGIDIGGDGRGCNTITGAFQVEAISWNGTTLTEFMASFEQHCEGGTPALRGCVHYVQ
jgi:hypothetical protein